MAATDPAATTNSPTAGGWTLDATGRRVRVDAAGNRIYPGAVAYMDDSDPFAQGDAAADIAGKQKRGAQQAGIAAGIGAVAQLGQAALTFIDTEQDTYNRQRLNELEDLRKANALGLSGAERQHAEHTLLDPVRAMGAENRERAEARMSAMGGASAADLAGVRREAEQRTNEASIDASNRIETMHLAAAEAQRAEAEERRSYESSRQRQRVEMIGQTLAGLAAQAGPVLASLAAPTEPTDTQFRAMQNAKNADGTPAYPGYQGMTADQMRSAWRAEYKAAMRPDSAAYRTGQSVPAE